jgi:hypothetical protein
VRFVFVLLSTATAGAAGTQSTTVWIFEEVVLEKVKLSCIKKI